MSSSDRATGRSGSMCECGSMSGISASAAARSRTKLSAMAVLSEAAEFVESPRLRLTTPGKKYKRLGGSRLFYSMAEVEFFFQEVILQRLASICGTAIGRLARRLLFLQPFAASFPQRAADRWRVEPASLSPKASLPPSTATGMQAAGFIPLECGRGREIPPLPNLSDHTSEHPSIPILPRLRLPPR